MEKRLIRQLNFNPVLYATLKLLTQNNRRNYAVASTMLPPAADVNTPVLQIAGKRHIGNFRPFKSVFGPRPQSGEGGREAAPGRGAAFQVISNSVHQCIKID